MRFFPGLSVAPAQVPALGTFGTHAETRIDLTCDFRLRSAVAAQDVHNVFLTLPPVFSPLRTESSLCLSGTDS